MFKLTAPRSIVIAVAVLVSLVLTVTYVRREQCDRQVSVAAAVEYPPPARLPVSDENIHLGLAFDSDVGTPDPRLGRVDYVWGGTERRLSPAIYTDAYLPYDRDDSSEHSLDYWKAGHPDWVVYACDKVTPAYEYGDPNVPLDISNPAVQQYQLSRVAERVRRGYDGIAWDNVRLRNTWKRCGVWRNGQWVALYTGGELDERFQSDVVSWARAIHDRIKAMDATRGISFNLSVDREIPDAFARLAPYFDNDYDERGFTGYGQKLLTDDRWLEELSALQYLDQQGKAFVVNGIVDAPTDAAVTSEQVQWVVANYLLVKGKRSYTNVYPRTRSGGDYGGFYDRPELRAPVGHPTSSVFRDQDVYLRRYSGGLAVVNPSGSQTRTVTITGRMKDATGRPVTSLRLAPASGAVLLAERPPTAPASTAVPAAAAAARAPATSPASRSSPPAARPVPTSAPAAGAGTSAVSSSTSAAVSTTTLPGGAGRPNSRGGSHRCARS